MGKAEANNRVSGHPRAAARVSDDTRYDRILRWLKNHPIGLVILAAGSLVAWLGPDNLRSWPEDNPECRYVIVEPLYEPNGTFDADLIGQTRQVMFAVETQAGFKQLNDLRRIHIVTFKSYDAREYELRVSVGAMSDSKGELPKGWVASQSWRGRMVFDAASHYLLTVTPSYSDYRVRGSHDNLLTVKPLSRRERDRYTEIATLMFPECESVNAGIA